MTGVICFGDLTTGGGKVVRCQLASTHRIRGRPIAVMGDLATCRKHKGEFAFMESHPQRRLQGKPVVLQGHRLACGCHALADGVQHVSSA